MITTDKALRDSLLAIASGQHEITPDVQKAIDLGLAKKQESVFSSASRLVLTPKGVSAIGVL